MARMKEGKENKKMFTYLRTATSSKIVLVKYPRIDHLGEREGGRLGRLGRLPVRDSHLLKQKHPPPLSTQSPPPPPRPYPQPPSSSPSTESVCGGCVSRDKPPLFFENRIIDLL